MIGEMDKMDWKKEWKPLLWIVAAFLALFYLPVGTLRFDRAISKPCTWPSGTRANMCSCA